MHRLPTILGTIRRGFVTNYSGAIVFGPIMVPSIEFFTTVCYAQNGIGIGPYAQGDCEAFIWIEENEKVAFTVYFNAENQLLQLKNSQSSAEYFVLNSFGQNVLTTSENQISTLHWAPGLYLVIAIGENGVLTERIVIQ